MSESVLLVGVFALVVGYGVLVVRAGTAGLGLNALNLFAIGTATLSAFVVAALSRRVGEFFGADELFVVSYSLAGLFAMLLGLFLAWRPLIRERSASLDVRVEHLSRHLSERTGWLTFCVGAAAEAIYPFVFSIPTISTGVFCVTTLNRVGLCILLLAAVENGRWARFTWAMAMFAALSVASSFATGFSFIRINTLVPLGVIWIASGGSARRLIQTLVVGPLCALVMASALAAWLDTRVMIRSRSLEALPFTDQAGEFFSAYVDNLSIPTSDSLLRTLLERVDMTSLLAAQVQYQPSQEPYAHGSTVVSSFFTLIPRALWPTKPTVAGGSEFVSRFTGLRWSDETSVGLPYPFELYANGGAALVVLGLGFIGYVGGKLELKIMTTQASLGRFWALALVTAVITEGGQRVDVVLPALVASAVTAFILGALIERLLPLSSLPPTAPARRPLLNADVSVEYRAS